MGKPKERYRKYLDSFANPWAARYSLIGYARTHGPAAAARMSGAHISTVTKLLHQARTGKLRARPPGRPPLTVADKMRIARARVAHPNSGAKKLKEDFGLPYGVRQIKRILREYELVPKSRSQIDVDPKHWRTRHEELAKYAKMNMLLSKIARLVGFTGRMADVETHRRRIEREERKAEWWAERIRKKARQASTDLSLPA
jgi:transposase